MTFYLSESQLHPNDGAYSPAMKTTWNYTQILFLFSLMTSNLYYLVPHHRNVKNHKDPLENSEECRKSSQNLVGVGGWHELEQVFFKQHCKEGVTLADMSLALQRLDSGSLSEGLGTAAHHHKCHIIWLHRENGASAW